MFGLVMIENVAFLNQLLQKFYNIVRLNIKLCYVMFISPITKNYVEEKKILLGILTSISGGVDITEVPGCHLLRQMRSH